MSSIELINILQRNRRNRRGFRHLIRIFYLQMFY